jgi:hypothetical protein
MTAIPPLPDADAARRLAEAVNAAPRLSPFAQAAKDILAELSRRILAAPDLARRAEAVALGFWLRPANVAALEADFAGLSRPGSLRVPAGLALHFPPANVDTMPIYSWALSLLAGNHNIVRLSARRGALATRLVELAGEVLAERPELAAGNAFVQYGHDDATSAALSAACDLRVIWGGNASVAKVRAIPLPPYAKEVAFADRLSLAALVADEVVNADAASLARLAQGLFNDVYSFDQMGCSSPRLLVWVGTPEHARAAADRLEQAMEAELARRGHHIDPALAMAKLVFACGLAADGTAQAIRRRSTDWMVADLGDGLPSPLPHDHCGGGLLLACRVDRLTDIAPAVDRSVQTLTHFGFGLDTLEELAHACLGRGIDRMVPVGEALAFGALWDGYDLWNEMTRVVAVRA